MYLADTNIFLEILLGQRKAKRCQSFLNSHIDQIYISDFSLHSIGVILFRLKKETILAEVYEDIFASGIGVLSLSRAGLLRISEVAFNFDLDYDDAYQYLIAKENAIALVTLDKNFHNADIDTIAP